MAPASVTTPPSDRDADLPTKAHRTLTGPCIARSLVACGVLFWMVANMAHVSADVQANVPKSGRHLPWENTEAEKGPKRRFSRQKIASFLPTQFTDMHTRSGWRSFALTEPDPTGALSSLLPGRRYACKWAAFGVELGFELHTLQNQQARLMISGLINSNDVIEYETSNNADGSVNLFFDIPKALSTKTKKVMTTLKTAFIDTDGTPVVIVRPPIPFDVKLRLRPM